MFGIRSLTTIATLLLVSCVGLRASPQRFEYRQIHMGVEARIVLYAADAAQALTAARAAYTHIAGLDSIMSDYRDDSELNRLRDAPVYTWIPVSDPLWTVLEAARHLAHLSDGAFDVTAGPQVRLWREARRSGTAPDSAARAAALAASGWTALHLDPETRSVGLALEGMQLDLGGIAKGFAADEALRLLREHGIPRALVEFGGDIAAGDPPPGSAGWEIRLAGAHDPGSPVRLARAAISTSGDAVQYVEIDGVRHSHVVDPRTGAALRDQFTATVIAPRAMLSDALATLSSVLGPGAAEQFVATHFPEAQLRLRRVEPVGEEP